MKAAVTIKKNSEFRRLYSRGRCTPGPYLVLYTAHDKTGGNRVGYTVSVKLGKAVVRNRIKRRLRENRLHALRDNLLRRGNGEAGSHNPR